ncbi:MAG: SDR family oxidoreductase [Acidimicrobiales bacterium]
MTTKVEGLQDKVAVVTGAARGVGAALAKRLAEGGARVALVGLEPAELEATAAACRRHGDSQAWTADVTDLARMQSVAAEVVERFGRVDIVVANAGIAVGGLFAQSDPASFDRVIEVNLLGSIATARAFLPALVDSGGYLLQVASMAALLPAPLMAAYCASKSGVEAFAHVLAAEVAPKGVAVGVAYLSWTDTDMVRAADEVATLKKMRSGLPWPLGATARLAPTVERIARGIEQRAPHVYGQAWVRTLQWLPRGAVASVTARIGGGRVSGMGAQLEAAGGSTDPVGPGGRAAMTAESGLPRP